MTVIVDLVSDFICPWCYIGRHNLHRAFDGADVTVRWHPYFLNPGLPPGVDRTAYMIAKFGSMDRAREIGRGVEEAAREAGLELDLGKVKTMPNTADAHRLMRWAAGQGVADTVAGLLFAAHFDEGRDIADHGVLAGIAAAAGMDGALVAELLAGDADAEIVDVQAERARDAGISGVPTYVLNGKLLVVGAQPVAALQRALAKAEAALSAAQA